MQTVALVTLGDPHQLTGGYLYHQRLADRAARHDARLTFVSLPQRPFPLPAIAAGQAMQQVKSAGADVAVIDSIAAAFLGPSLAMRHPGVPLVGMLHQPPGVIDAGGLRRAIQTLLDRWTYRYTPILLVASEALAASLVAAGIPRHRLRVVPPGRDVAPRPDGPLPDLRQGRRIALLAVGNWVERKGIHSLVEAFSRLPADTATLHLVGNDNADPRYARRIHERLQRADLAGRVVIHGPLPTTEVARLYAAADVFVLPSTREPYGTVYGEAMAAGLPVVGWAAGNLPFLAAHEREGLIVPTGDVAALAAALQRLADDPSLRRRLGEAGRQRAAGRPTWDETAALFFTAVREASHGT